MIRFRPFIVLLSLVALLAPGCATPSSPPPAGPVPRVEPAPAATPTRAATPSAPEDQPPLGRFPSPLIVSVLYFEDRAVRPELLWLRKGLADMLVAALSRRRDLIVVQRERLDEVLREQALQHSGRIADDAGVAIGHMLGATVLVTGSLATVGEQLRLEAQLIGVERGAVLGTATADGNLNQAAAVASDLVERVVGLLPGDERAPAGASSTSELFDAVKDNVAAEELTREGKLWRALEAYERALAVSPSYGPARRSYGRILDAFSGTQLLRVEDVDGARARDRQRLHRLAARLVGRGLDVRTGVPRVSSVRPDAATLLVPVTLRVAPAAVDAVLEASLALGGQVSRSAQAPDGPIDVVPSSDPGFNQAFVEEISRPRRLYLRLLGRSGRTLGIYSQWRDWNPLTWVHPIDDQTVRIERQRTVKTHALFPGLSETDVRHLTAVKLTVDEVPRERGTVSLDVRAPLAARGRSSGTDADAGRSRPDSGGADQARAAAAPDLEPLRALMESVWNPPVSERPWARGHVPGNERRTVVGLTLDPSRPAHGAVPRVIRSSGDPLFDKAAVAATRQGLARWHPAPPVSPPPMPPGSPPPPRPTPEIRVLRVQFQLIKDIPALNLIEAQTQAMPLAPLHDQTGADPAEG